MNDYETTKMMAQTLENLYDKYSRLYSRAEKEGNEKDLKECEGKIEVMDELRDRMGRNLYWSLI